LLPPSSFPNVKAKKALKKISMIDLSTWGWFKFNKNNNDVIQNLKKFQLRSGAYLTLNKEYFLQKDFIFQ
jgi:hypothetical protein